MNAFDFRCLAAIPLALVVLSGAASAQTARLTGDSYTSPATASTNYGSAPALLVTGAASTNALTGGPGNRAYVQFNLSTLPAGTTAASVANATPDAVRQSCVRGGKHRRAADRKRLE